MPQQGCRTCRQECGQARLHRLAGPVPAEGEPRRGSDRQGLAVDGEPAPSYDGGRAASTRKSTTKAQMLIVDAAAPDTDEVNA